MVVWSFIVIFLFFLQQCPAVVGFWLVPFQEPSAPLHQRHKGTRSWKKETYSPVKARTTEWKGLFVSSSTTTSLFTLSRAGDAFLELAKSTRTMDSNLNDNNNNTVTGCTKEESALFRRVGQALVEAGKAWTEDWMETTIAMEEASAAFSDLSKLIHNDADDDDDDIQKPTDSTSTSSSSTTWFSSRMYRTIADEFADASTIGGCVSIGPPSSVPNLQVIRDCLNELSSNCSSSSYSECFNEASNAIQALVLELEG